MGCQNQSIPVLANEKSLDKYILIFHLIFTLDTRYQNKLEK